jgi:hypothetical protein
MAIVSRLLSTPWCNRGARRPVADSGDAGAHHRRLDGTTRRLILADNQLAVPGIHDVECKTFLTDQWRLTGGRMPARAAWLSASLLVVSTLGLAEPSREPRIAPRVSSVELRIATLHAAALTPPNGAPDSVDSPYLLVSVVGPRTTSHAFTFPADGRWRIHRDEALGARALETLRIGDGDSVRVLVTVMEGGQADRSMMDRAAEAMSGRAANHGERNRIVSAAVEALVSGGARWLGSAALVLTRDAGVSYWRGLDCLATCKVISGAAPVSLDAAAPASPSGVIELSGAGATYHLKLEALEHGR